MKIKLCNKICFVRWLFFSFLPLLMLCSLLFCHAMPKCGIFSVFPQLLFLVSLSLSDSYVSVYRLPYVESSTILFIWNDFHISCILSNSYSTEMYTCDKSTYNTRKEIAQSLLLYLCLSLFEYRLRVHFIRFGSICDCDSHPDICFSFAFSLFCCRRCCCYCCLWLCRIKIPSSPLCNG